MNTYNRSQGMDNRLNMLFNQELDNEAQYIKSHPFSAINMSLGGEVRYIAPVWPWNAPRFQAIDWRTQPPPDRIPGNTKHDQGKLFQLPKTWNETTNKCWEQDTKPPPCFPYASGDATKDGAVIMTAGARRSATNTPASRPPQTRDSDRDRDQDEQPESLIAPENAGPPSRGGSAPQQAREQPASASDAGSRPPPHPRLPSAAGRSVPDSRAGGSRFGSGGPGRASGERDVDELRLRGSPPRVGQSSASDRQARAPQTSRPPTNGSGPRRESGGSQAARPAVQVEPLRLDLPVSQLPGRPKTNGSSGRMSVRSNGSARRVAQEMVGGV